MHGRADIRLFSRLGLRVEGAGRADGAQLTAVVGPDVVVARAGALEAVVVIGLEGVVGARVGLLGETDGRACDMAVSTCTQQ